MPQWELPKYILDNFDKVGTDYLRLTVDQSEKLVNETVRNGEGVTQKANIILGAAVTIMTVSAGAFFQQTSQSNPNLTFIEYTILQGCFAFACICILIYPLTRYIMRPIGAPPSSYLQEKLFSELDTMEDRIRSILLSQCVSNQFRIDTNEARNRQRVQFVDIAMYLLSASPFVSALLSYSLNYLIRS